MSKNDENHDILDKKNYDTICGVKLDSPHDLAIFLLTQMYVRSGIDCILGHAHIPKAVNHSIINWDETILVLNRALKAVQSDKSIQKEEDVTLNRDYSYVIKNDISKNCFFLNEEKVFTFQAMDRDLESALPRKSMMEWIKKNKSTNIDNLAHLDHLDIEKDIIHSHVNKLKNKNKDNKLINILAK